MRYFEINEGAMGRTYDSVRSNPISIEEAGQLIRQNCTDIINKQEIWRGTRKDDQALLVDSKIGQRQSANTKSYLNLILDNSKSWNSFPNRLESLICSNDDFNANNYGRVYRVFPYNGTKIGICPASDFWVSFKEIHVAKFNETVGRFYNYFFNTELPEDSQILVNLSKLSDTIASNPKIIKKLIDGDDWAMSVSANYMRYLTDELSAANLNEFISHYLNPIQQKFKTKTTKNYYSAEAKIPQEIWFSGKAVMVKKELVYDTLSSVFTYTQGSWQL